MRLRVLPVLLISLLVFGIGALAALYRSGAAAARSTATTLPDLGGVPAFSLTGSDGAPVGSGDLFGEPWVVDFIFTSCAGVCPLMTMNMAGIQEALPEGWSGKLVSVTVDPERDTPEVLQRYAARYGAQPGRWLFLTGDLEEIYRLSIEGFRLGAAVSSEADLAAGAEPFIHSTKMVLVDAAGRVRGYYDGIDAAETRQLLEDLVDLEEPPEEGA